MIKVLFTTNIPSPYRVEFFNQLSKYVDLTVIYFWEKGLDNHPWKIDEDKHQYHYIVPKEFKIGKIRFNPRVVSMLRNGNFDVHIIGGYSLISEMISIIYLKLKKIPFFLNSDGGFIKNDFKILGWYKRFLISSAYGWLTSGKNSTATLVHYGANSSRVTEYCFSSISENDILIKCPDTNEKKALRKGLGLPETDKMLLTVGQFIYRKGIDILLECAKNDTSESLYVIIGQGPFKGNYEKYIEDKDIHNVLILDFMSRDKLKKYYMAADIFILPTREDIWGLVVNEAISNGLPIIATERTGSVHDLVLGNGKIISPTATQIGQAIDELASSEGSLYRLGEKSLAIARGYTIENMVKKHVEAIDKLYGLKRGILHNQT